MVPRLRFGEFKVPSERIKLDAVTSWSSGGTPSKENESFWSGNIPWISASSMRGQQFDDSELKISEEGLRSGSRLSKPNSILILTRGSMLYNKVPVGINSIPVAFNQDLKSIAPDVDRLKSEYLLYYLLHKQSDLLQMVTGTGIGAGKLETSELKNLDLDLPSIEEQTKIATFLTAIDNRVSQLKKKKTLLEEYKKGMMQKIFSREVRFRDESGLEFAEWIEVRLREIGKFVGGGTPSKYEDEYWNGKIPWISSSDLSEDSITKISITRFLSEKGVQNSPVKILPKHSVVIVSRVGVGKIAVNDLEITTSQDFCSLVQAEHDPYFLAYLIKTKTADLLGFNQGTSIKGFVKSDIEEMEIALPSISEQIKIAQFLTALDDKIAQTASQIAKVEVFKKGLLGEMFV